jgi:hypothetical protein
MALNVVEHIVFMAGIVILLLCVVVELVEKKYKPHSFNCPHCDATLTWSDTDRSYLETISGWTAATDGGDSQ